MPEEHGFKRPGGYDYRQVVPMPVLSVYSIIRDCAKRKPKREKIGNRAQNSAAAYELLG